MFGAVTRSFSKMFNMVAVTAAFLFMAGGSAYGGEAAKLIPDGAVPDYMGEAYAKMGGVGKEYQHLPYINIYRELYGEDIDLYKNFPAGPYSFIGKMKNMSSADAEKEALRCIAKQCFNKLPGDRLMNVIASFEALRHNDVTPREHIYYKVFLNSLRQSPKYQMLQEKKINESVASLMGNPAFLSNIGQWLPAEKITKDNASAQYDLHKEGLQLVSDEIRATFGLKPALIVLDNLSEKIGVVEKDGVVENGGVGATGMVFPPEMTDEMSGGKQLVVIDYSAWHLGVSPWSFIEATSHETRHSIDQEMARQLIKGWMDPEINPHFHHIATVILNGHAYQNGNSSSLQYTERSAAAFGRDFVRALQTALGNIQSKQQRSVPGLI